MFFARMSEGRERSFSPLREQGVAFLRRRLDGGREPGVEGAGAIGGLRLKISAQVMEAHTTADDKHPFIAQRSESATGCDVQRRIK